MLKKTHKQKHKSFAVRSANLYFPPHINVVGSDINGCYVLRCAVFYFLSTSSTFDESILIRSCFSWRLRMLNVVGFLWIFGSQSNTEVIHDAWDGGHTGAELRGSRREICPMLECHFSISVRLHNRLFQTSWIQFLTYRMDHFVHEIDKHGMCSVCQRSHHCMCNYSFR